MDIIKFEFFNNFSNYFQLSMLIKIPYHNKAAQELIIFNIKKQVIFTINLFY